MKKKPFVTFIPQDENDKDAKRKAKLLTALVNFEYEQDPEGFHKGIAERVFAEMIGLHSPNPTPHE